MIYQLRALEPSDLSALLEAENNQEAYMNSDNYLPFSKAVLEKYLNGEHDLLKHHQYRYAIDANGECAGFIDLFDYNPVHSRAGVGIYIVENQRGKGIAFHALQRLIEVSKVKLNIEYLHASISESNKASLNLFEKCGFQKNGIRTAWQKRFGKRKAVVLYELLLD